MGGQESTTEKLSDIRGALLALPLLLGVIASMSGYTFVALGLMLLGTGEPVGCTLQSRCGCVARCWCWRRGLSVHFTVCDHRSYALVGLADSTFNRCLRVDKMIAPVNMAYLAKLDNTGRLQCMFCGVWIAVHARLLLFLLTSKVLGESELCI